MTEKERKKLHDKGIFTVTQLSYTSVLAGVPKGYATNGKSITTH